MSVVVNGVEVSLAKSSGTGSFVGSNTPTLVTPAFGASTATSVVFNPSTGGLVGTTAGTAVSTGYVGELITNTASGVSLTGGSSQDVVTISLGSGDWDVYGNLSFSGTSTLMNALSGWISLISATRPDSDYAGPTYPGGGSLLGYNQPPGFAVPYQRVLISRTTTVYLSCNLSFVDGSANAAGILSARRRR